MKNEKYHYLYGYYPVLEALKANKRKFYALFLDEKIKNNSREKEFLSLAEKNKVAIEYKPNKELAQIAKTKSPQNVVLKSGAIVFTPLEVLLKEKKEKNLWVGLSQIQDPQNVGAILRTCLYFQIKNIFLTSLQSCPLSATVSKTSAGAMEQLNFCIPMNFSLLVRRLKKEKFWVVGTSLKGNSFQEQPLIENCFLIFGNEQKGLPVLLEKSCDFLWKIEGGGTNSLNVSASSAIILNSIYQNYQ